MLRDPRKIFALLLIGGLVAIAAAVALGYGSYTVAKGDTLWNITKELGVSPTRWPEIFEANPGLKKVERNGKTIVLLYPGQQIAIPDTIVPVPVVEAQPAGAIKPRRGRRAQLVVPVEPEFKSAVWQDILFLAVLAFLIAALLYLLRGQIKASAKQARATVERGVRELINVFFPTALQPCYVDGVSERDVARITGWDPDQLQLKPVYGEYDVNIRLADGRIRSERRVLNGELGYSRRGTSGETVVLKGCGNPARRVSAQRQTVQERLVRAARRTFRPEPLRPAMEIRPQVPCMIGPKRARDLMKKSPLR